MDDGSRGYADAPRPRSSRSSDFDSGPAASREIPRWGEGPRGFDDADIGPSSVRRERGRDLSGEGTIDIPTIGTIPPRAAFPKVTVNSDQSRPRESGPATRRRESAPERPRTAPSDRGGVSPSRDVDQRRILDRYRAPSSDRARPTDGATATGPSRRIGDRGDRSVSSDRAPQPDRTARIQNAREERRAAREQRIANAREKSTFEQTRSLRDLARKNPERARNFERAGKTAADVTNITVGIGVGATIGSMSGGWWNQGCWNGYEDGSSFSSWCWWNGWYGSNWCWWNNPCNLAGWWGWGSWWGNCGWGASVWVNPGWCSWGGYGYYNRYPYYGYPYYGGGYGYSYPSYYSVPIYYSAAIADAYVEPEQTTYAEPAQEGEGYVEPEYEGGRRAKASDTSDKELLDSLLLPSSKGGMARAAEQYLVLGDSAFKDRRYGDAAHFYAKAVEFSPGDGMLYLILSDALFATGDYHYAAYALRKGLDLDPTLATAKVDKHDFYATDPTEFDRQIAVLELYVKDQPTDHDARLVLAANYLFSKRAKDAVDLLDQPASQKVREEAAGRLIYEAAKTAQFG